MAGASSLAVTAAWGGLWLAASPAQAASPCTATLCVLDPSAKDALRAQPGTISVTGAILVNSTNSEAALASGESGTALITATTTIGGPAAPAGFAARNTGAFSPAPVNQSAGTDPYASLPLCPGDAACPTTPTPPFPDVTLSTGSRTISPGVYGSITVSGGAHLTLAAGTFVVTGGVSVTGTGSQLTGGGVTIYLGCATYPTPCGATVSGAPFTADTGASVALTAPTTGDYAGLSLIADRSNKATIRISASSSATAGGVYAAAARLTVSAATASFTRVVVGIAETTGAQSARLTVAPPPGGLSITVPATAAIGSGGPGATLSSSIGAVTVTDQRGLSSAAWTATVSITDFTGSSGFTVAKGNASYWSGPATATTGSGTFIPGQPTAAQAQPLGQTLTAFRLQGGSGANSATWRPTLVIAVPLSAVAGTYTATLTHSVA
ncbi:hypothetical protein [Micromonospora sp. NPDC006431]|uniref:hypothetical protein n=1 Tax=Micromonospora sp. NPDC006431 TaxID=3364235 RepID=UPI00368ADDB4